VVLSWERGPYHPGEVPSSHKALDSPLTSADNLRSGGWGLGLRVSGKGSGFRGGLEMSVWRFRVVSLGFGA
jgi:hypothetical protein